MNTSMLIGIFVPLIVLIISFGLTWMLYKRFSKNLD